MPVSKVMTVGSGGYGGYGCRELIIGRYLESCSDVKYGWRRKVGTVMVKDDSFVVSSDL